MLFDDLSGFMALRFYGPFIVGGSKGYTYRYRVVRH